jgi:hypothetical protein
MRPPSRAGSDPADPLIRLTLRNWVLSVHPPIAGRKRLLGAAWLASAGRERKPKAVGVTSAHVVGTVWGLMNAAFANPAGNSVQRALAGAVIHREPNGLLTGHIRREDWHPFSLGIGLLTVIR